MSQYDITVTGGSSMRLLTAGKYCDRDIVVAAEGGGENQLPALLAGTITSIRSDAEKVVGYACRGLNNLVTVELPEAASIGTYAFYACTGLTTFVGPKVATLNSYAFYGCSRLAEICLPLASSVPSSCFYQCTNLKRADLGAAKSIGSSGFAYCSKLDVLILRRTDAVVTLNSSGFSGANFDGFVYVPAALADSYKEASNWTTHASRIRAIEDYPEICGT